jgi:hypothetical protein
LAPETYLKGSVTLRVARQTHKGLSAALVTLPVERKRVWIQQCQQNMRNSSGFGTSA